MTTEKLFSDLHMHTGMCASPTSYTCTQYNNNNQLGVVAHVFNTSTWAADIGGSL